MKTVFLMFLCAGSYVAASGVSKCWSCSDATCNDPFNSKNAVIMNCSNPNNYRSAPGSNEWSEDVNAILRKFSTYSSSDTDNVCVKYHVNSKVTENYDFTMRLCSPKKVYGQDICDAIKQTIGATAGPVDMCKTCDSDLCNSASIFDMSLISILVFLSLGHLLR